MSITSRAKQYGNVFGSWKIRESLGGGAQGKTGVFRIVKKYEEVDDPEESVLKVVNVIQEDGYPEELTAGMRADYEQRRKLLRLKAVREVTLMKRLSWSPYVVSYQAWDFSDWDDEGQFGCDLLIQMRRLKTLKDVYENVEKFDDEDILKVGRDICQALILCDEEQIVHRDIKPSNIFIDPQGRGCYMLGDFGISRIIDRSQYTSSVVFTPAYAAPEQISAGGTAACDKRADLYSLGLTLYVLANGGCLPFAGSKQPTEKEIALRLAGNPLPDPCDAEPGLAAMICRACAFRAEDRYQSAAEMLAALEELTPGSHAPDTFQTRAARAAKPAAVPPEPRSEPEQPPGTAESCQCAGEAGYWKLSLPQLRKLAVAGDADAQFFLGIRCHLGIGVERDLSAALQLYKMAASLGNADAQTQLERLEDISDTGQDAGQLRITLGDVSFTAPDKNGKPQQYDILCTTTGAGTGRVHVIFTRKSTAPFARWTRIYASSVRLAAHGNTVAVMRAVRTQAELDELRLSVANLINHMRDSDPSAKFSDYRDDYSMPALPPVSEIQNELPWRSLLLMI